MFFILLFFLAVIQCFQLGKTYECPDDRLYRGGNIQIGGLFDLHNTAPITDSDGVTHLYCDSRYQDTVVLVEAMVFAIEKINEDSKILPSIQLGYDIQGTCDDSLENMFYALDAYTDLEYKYANVSPLEARPCDYGPAIAGLVGPGSSAGSASVASLFRLFDIPVLSYDATSPELGNHMRYPTFFRTIYADDKQAAALVDLVEHFQWNYIAAIGSDDRVGREGIYQFKQIMWKRTHLCLAFEGYFGDEAKLQQILQKIKLTRREEGGNITTNVTLLFMDWSHAVRFLKMATKYELNETTWLGVDHWTANMSMTYDLPGFLPGNFTNGVISTEISSQVPLQFLSWITGFIEKRMEKNHWLFRYYCETCTLALNHTLPSSPDNCTLEFTRSEACLNKVNIGWIVRKQRRISNVISAVYALAYALDELRRKGELKPNAKRHYHIPYNSLVNILDNMNITSTIPVLCDDHDPIKFDHLGNLEGATFEIHNFYGNSSKRPATDRGDGHGIGKWTENDKEHPLHINSTYPIVWRTGSKPVSHCFRDCIPGEKVIYSPSLCCWDCEPCPIGTYSNTTQSTDCTVCPAHFHTNLERNKCLPNTKTWISWRDALGITNSIFCSLGQICVIISAVLSYIYRESKPFSDKYTMKIAVLLNCSFGYTYIVYQTMTPRILLCSARRVAWQTGVTAHCVAGFFQIHWGRQQALRLQKFKIPSNLCTYVAYGFFTLLGFLSYLLIAILQPPKLDLTDLAKITLNHADQTYLDCGEGAQGIWVIGFSVLYPGIFWLTSVIFSIREVQYHKRSSLIASLHTVQPTFKMRNDYLTVQFMLYSSYICLLVVGALAPIYVTMEDPWNRSFLLLIGAFIANSAILGLYLLPRAKRVICTGLYDGLSRHDSRLREIFITTGNTTALPPNLGDRRNDSPKPRQVQFK